MAGSAASIRNPRHILRPCDLGGVKGMRLEQEHHAQQRDRDNDRAAHKKSILLPLAYFPVIRYSVCHNLLKGSRMTAISVPGRCLTRWMIVVLCAASWAMAQEPEGAVIYRQECALCHENPAKTRAQPLAALRLMSPENIVRALESGRMKDQGTLLTAQQKRAVAACLAGKP